MVEVPAGAFWMGANKDGTQCPTNALDGQAEADEVPCHQVTVPAFRIDKYEVTVAAYKACVDAGACTTPSACFTYSPWGVIGKEQYPVDCVTWIQAQQHCFWTGRRLCSEAEWEKAARGTDGRLYPWGDQAATCDYAVMGGCGNQSMQPVGSKNADVSPFGAMDMGGNVREWVQDWNYGSYNGAPTDGTAWEIPSGSARVTRGGCYDGGAAYARTASRYLLVPTAAATDVGVRCCTALEP
jgi:formylglycine-generating enzyme required for sulfatase activity